MSRSTDNQRQTIRRLAHKRRMDDTARLELLASLHTLTYREAVVTIHTLNQLERI